MSSEEKGSIEIKTGFGRPRTLGILRHTTIYLYEKYRDVYEKAIELARREGKSFSELISIALKEYVENHYPGNPQLSMESFTENGLKPLRLEAKLLLRSVRGLLENLKNPKVWDEHKEKIRRHELPPKLVKLAKLNSRLRDEEIRKIIEEAEKEVFRE